VEEHAKRTIDQLRYTLLIYVGLLSVHAKDVVECEKCVVSSHNLKEFKEGQFEVFNAPGNEL
jgi:hypothetical protein